MYLIQPSSEQESVVLSCKVAVGAECLFCRVAVLFGCDRGALQ